MQATARRIGREAEVQKIDAIVRPERVEAVKAALVDLGHRGITVGEVKGHGIQGGVRQQWRGEDYEVDLLPKALVTVVAHEHELADCLDVIVRAARTGRMGDGKVFVTPVSQVVRVRTGETGTDAL